MLNFAALAFTQDIDNVFFEFAKNGYLTDFIEEVAKEASELTMPQRTNKCATLMDSVMFAVIYLVLLAGWIIVLLRDYWDPPVF